MTRPVRTLTVLGKRWRFRFVSLRALGGRGKRWGVCDSPSDIGKELLLWHGMDERKSLEIALHEMLHAAGWHLDEKFVERAAKDFSTNLWKLGVRWPGRE